MIRGLIHQVDVAILNVCLPHKGATNHMKQKPIDLKIEMNKSTILSGDFNTFLSTMVELDRKN